MKKHLVWLSLLVLGCASPEAKITGTTPLAPVSEASKIYSKSIMPMTLDQAQTFGCPKTSRATDTYAKSDWKELVGMANACVKTQKWNQVEVLADALSIKDPKAPWSAYFWALSAEQKGDIPRALWMTDLAIKKAPDMGMLYFEKGRLLWHEKTYGLAMDSFLKAVQLDGALTDAHIFLGQIYFRDQDYSKATQHFYTALRARPSDPIALSGLAESRLQAGDANGALEAIKRAVSAYPDRVEFALREAYIFENVIGDKIQALQAYRSVQNIVLSRRIRGAVASNLDKKIVELEKSTRQPSSLKPGVKQ